MRGAVLMIAGMAVLTLNDAVMKLVVSELPLGEAVGLRGLGGCLVMMVFAPWLGGLRALWPRSLRNAAVLSGLLLVTLFMFPFSLQHMPLADGIMLVSLATVLAAMLSPWLLSEKVGWRRWSAIALGLVGAWLVLDPGGAPLTWISLLPLLVALIVAVRDILTRRYIVGESAVALVFMASLFAAVAGLATTPFDWITPSPRQWGMIAVVSCLVSLAMVLATAAFHYAGAVVLSCLKYSAIVWAALLDWLIWSEAMDSLGWLGAALITISGVVISVRERRAA